MISTGTACIFHAPESPTREIPTTRNITSTWASTCSARSSSSNSWRGSQLHSKEPNRWKCSGCSNTASNSRCPSPRKTPRITCPLTRLKTWNERMNTTSSGAVPMVEINNAYLDSVESELSDSIQERLQEAIQAIVNVKKSDGKVVVVTGSGPNIHEGVTTLVAELIRAGIVDGVITSSAVVAHELAGALDLVKRVPGDALGFDLQAPMSIGL